MEKVREKDLNRFTRTKQVQILAYSVCKCLKTKKIKYPLKLQNWLIFSHSQANEPKKSKKEDLVKMYVVFLASC